MPSAFRRIRPLLLLLRLSAFLCAIPVAASAQSLDAVRPGNRVQLTIRDSLRPGPITFSRQVMIGRFVRATTDSVWLRPMGASEFSVARANITRARESLGASRVRSAFTFAFGLGFALAAAEAIDQIDCKRDHRGRDVLIAGGVGFGGGMIIGAISPFEHWRGLRR